MDESMNSELQTTRDTGISFGSSELDAEDFIPPRVKIIQAMSDERSQGVDEGSFYNTLTSEDYGPSLTFIPIGTFKNRIMLVRTERRKEINKALKTAGIQQISNDVEGLACRSLDMQVGRGTPGVECGSCPLSDWTGDDNMTPPLCSETYNVTAINDEGDLIILGFSKSSAKVGKRMFSMMRLTSGKPWKSQYEATTVEQKGAQGRYMVPVIKKTGAPPPELMKLAEEFAAQLSGVVIDVDSQDDEAPVPAPPEGEAVWEETGEAPSI
jgi:hypothetical protein